MKIESIICAAALTFVATLPTIAQVEKEVEVTQAFIPTLKSSTKPMLLPDMSDEAYISPDIDYSITPTSIHTELNPAKYQAIEMDYWEVVRQKNFYAKVGGGVPLQSVVDLFASSYREGRGYLVGFLTQDGQYAKIENDYGVKSNATRSNLRVGSAAGLFVGRKSLEGVVSYDNDLYTRYATPDTSDESILYQRIALRGSFGDSFTDWSRWNYAIKGEAEQMWSRADENNTTLGVALTAGGNIFGGRLLFSAGYDNISGSRDYLNSTIRGGVNYLAEGSRATLLVGVKYYNDMVESSGVDQETSHYLLPQLTIDYQLSKKRMIAYLDLDGELRHNSFAELSRINPYITPSRNFADRSTLEGTLDLGIKGLVGGDKLGYDISVGYGISANELYWAFLQMTLDNDESYNGYAVEIATRHNMGVAVELEYKPNSSLRFGFDGSARKYMDDMEWESGQAAVRLGIEGEYSIGRFDLGVKGELLSNRKFSEINFGTYSLSSAEVVEIPTTFDLGVALQYRTKGGAVAFCELSNLLGAELYQWARYREYGVGAMVGVRFEF